jgi:hypothetical protein
MFFIFTTYSSADSEFLTIRPASDMKTTTEQLMTDLTESSKDHHDEISTRPCAYTQLLVDALCTENKAHSENHNASLWSIFVPYIVDSCAYMRSWLKDY